MCVDGLEKRGFDNGSSQKSGPGLERLCEHQCDDNDAADIMHVDILCIIMTRITTATMQCNVWAQKSKLVSKPAFGQTKNSTGDAKRGEIL